MNRALLCPLAILLLFSLPVHGQDFPMLHYAIEDGLPSNNIYHVYRDSKGFLWFATDNGVARYNGLKFETFTTFDGLPDNEIFLFQEDHQGRLWLSTYNGELCYYKDGVFHTAANTPFLKLPFKVSHIYNISLEKDSSVSFNFFDWHVAVNIKDEKVSIANYKSILLSYKFEHDSFERTYITYKRKVAPDLYELVYEDKIIISDTNYNVKKFTRKNYGMGLVYIPCQDQGYFADPGFIYSDNLDTVKALKNSLYSGKTIYAYYYDGISSFVGTNDGLVINDTIHTLYNDNVSSITQDNEGNYWVSTLNNGVYCLRKDFLQSRIFQKVYDKGIKYSQNIRNNIFYVTQDNSLYKFENEKPICLFDGSVVRVNSYNSKEGGYLINIVNGDYCFVNTNKTIVYNWDLNTMHECIYDNVPGVKDLYLIDDYLYIKSRSDIVKVDYSKLKTDNHIEHEYLCPDSLQRVYGMANSPENTLWYSTLTNTYKFANGHFVSQPQFKNIAFKFFMFFNKYLIGYTHNNQLLVCSYLDNNITIDTIPQQNCIWDKIYKLDETHLLVCTNNLYRVLTFDPSSPVKKFSVSAIANPFIPKQAESICIDSVNCYFFKGGALTSISIKSILERPSQPTLYFTLLKTGKKSYPVNKETQIPFNESKNITVSFSRLLFNGKDISQQYSFSKNGEDNWIDVRGEEINIVSPGYGRYVMKLRAKSISSDYCTPIEFTLVISRPFWATWWFILLLAGAVVTMIIMAIRYRISYLLRKNEKEHETEIKFMKSEYKALNALMNPHFIFNTLNNVQGLVNRNDKLAANEYLRVFADLIRQNMHNISKELIPLQKEIDLVVNYLLLEKLRFKDLLNYEINIDKGIDLSEIMIPPLLVQPLVENSIKHGILPLESVEGQVNINIYERKGILYIEVKDNGVGMERSKNKTGEALHESFGMENIKKRIQQLSIIQNKDITFQIREETDNSGKLLWTVVVISMPIA